MNFPQRLRLVSAVIVGVWVVFLLYCCERHEPVMLQKPPSQAPLLPHVSDMIELGDAASSSVWIYLCGLTSDFDAADEVGKRMLLDKIGNGLHIKFLALKPPQRCPEFDNKLCWPHTTAEEVKTTYDYICQALKDRPYTGFIGFSNGSYFLTKLVQSCTLNKPIIAIGGAVHLNAMRQPNIVYLLVGTEDTYNYDVAQKFYNSAQRSPLKAELHTYDGGHVLLEKPLEVLLKSIASS